MDLVLSERDLPRSEMPPFSNTHPIWKDESSALGSSVAKSRKIGRCWALFWRDCVWVDLTHQPLVFSRRFPRPVTGTPCLEFFRGRLSRLKLILHCLDRRGGCSFGLFKCDRFVSFRAFGVVWGICELTAELVCLLFLTLCLVPYPVGPIIKT